MLRHSSIIFCSISLMAMAQPPTKKGLVRRTAEALTKPLEDRYQQQRVIYGGTISLPIFMHDKPLKEQLDYLARRLNDRRVLTAQQPAALTLVISRSVASNPAVDEFKKMYNVAYDLQRDDLPWGVHAGGLMFEFVVPRKLIDDLRELRRQQDEADKETTQKWLETRNPAPKL